MLNSLDADYTVNPDIQSMSRSSLMDPSDAKCVMCSPSIATTSILFLTQNLHLFYARKKMKGR
jgi:hypothetical protein